MSKKIINNFSTFGFNGNFNGKILEKVGDWYIGYLLDIEVIDDNGEKCKESVVAAQWFKAGGVVLAANTEEGEYDLMVNITYWYEDLNNFPCIIRKNNWDKNTYTAFSYSPIDKKILDENKIVICDAKDVKDVAVFLLVSNMMKEAKNTSSNAFDTSSSRDSSIFSF